MSESWKELKKRARKMRREAHAIMNACAVGPELDGAYAELYRADMLEREAAEMRKKESEAKA